MLVFIHMHKTGGNTLSHMLRSTYGLRHCQVEPWVGPPFNRDDLQLVHRLYPDLKSIAGHRITGHVDLADGDENGTDYQYFTLMRNPLKLCASRFQYKVQVSGKKNLVFEEWIQQDWPRNHQTKWLAGDTDVDKAIRNIKERKIFVGLTERFDESMVLLRALLANDLDISYRRVNVASKNSIKNRLLSDKRSRELLIEAQEADLELYNYVRREIYPTYQQAYGPSLATDVATYQETRSNRFNYWKLTLCRLKHYMLYKPYLKISRKVDAIEGK